MAALILSLLFVVMVAVGALVGFVRGLNKSVIRIMTLVLAIILTFIVSGPITTFLAENITIEGQTLGQIILENAYSNEMLAGILESAPLMQEAILASPALIIAIVVFPIAFLLFKFITWIVYVCVQKALRKAIFKDNGEKGSVGARIGKKFAGLGVGAIAGVLVFGMLMAPLFGLVSVLPEKEAIGEVMDILVEQEVIKGKDKDIVEIVKGELDVFDSAIIKAYSFMGITPAAKTYLGSVTKIEYGGTSTKLTDEFDSLFTVLQTAVEGELVSVILNMEDTSELYAVLSDVEFTNKLIADMFDSKLLCSAVPTVMTMAIESAARSLHVPEDKQAVYNEMISEISGFVKENDIDFDVIKAYEEAMGVSYIDSLDGASLSGAVTEEKYNAEIEKLEALKAKIAKILNKKVAGSDEELANAIAEVFVDAVKEEARENGKDSLKNFSSEQVKDAMALIKTEDINAGSSDKADDMLKKLSSADNFETNVATVETIAKVFGESVRVAVSDDEKTQETAGTISTVISDLAGAISGASDEKGEIDVTKLDFQKFASAVTALQTSDTLKDAGSAILDVVISGDLGKNEAIAPMLEGVKNQYDSGENIGETIEFAGAAIGFVSSMNGDESDITGSFESFIQTLTESTINNLDLFISPDVIVGMGIPEQYADSAFGVIKTLLTELMYLKGSSDYDSEVNAVLSIYNLATGSIDELGEEDMKKLAGYAVESDAIYNTLKSISVSNPFGIDIKSGSDREMFINAIESGYAESGKTQRELDIYKSVATLLGLEEEVELG